MTQGWSESDKRIAKAAIDRAKKRAEELLIAEFRKIQVKTFNDLWALEQTIQRWHKEVKYCFGFCHETAESDLAGHLKKGWLVQSDLNGMSESRMKRITS